MAISALDNTLWDLRGRYYKTPSIGSLADPRELQSKHTRAAWAYSLEPEKAQRARKNKADGFRHQKWFLAYGPGDGLCGAGKKV